MKRRVNRHGERADGKGLCQAGDAFKQDVAVREQADEQPVHQLFLADDDMADFLAQRGDPSRGPFHFLV